MLHRFVDKLVASWSVKKPGGDEVTIRKVRQSWLNLRVYELWEWEKYPAAKQSVKLGNFIGPSLEENKWDVLFAMISLIELVASRDSY